MDALGDCRLPFCLNVLPDRLRQSDYAVTAPRHGHLLRWLAASGCMPFSVSTFFPLREQDALDVGGVTRSARGAVAYFDGPLARGRRPLH